MGTRSLGSAIGNGQRDRETVIMDIGNLTCLGGYISAGATCTIMLATVNGPTIILNTKNIISIIMLLSR